MFDELNIIIFVLDDNKDELDLIDYEFRSKGITHYKLFDDYRKFMNEFSKGVHLAVIDYYLTHEKDGLEVVKEINSIHPLCHNIIVSGVVDADTVIQFFRCGASDFVSKNKNNYLHEITEAIKRATPAILNRIEIAKQWGYKLA